MRVAHLIFFAAGSALAQCVSRPDTAGRGDITISPGLNTTALAGVHASLEGEMAVLREVRSSLSDVRQPLMLLTSSMAAQDVIVTKHVAVDALCTVTSRHCQVRT
jgi:hypothetical protein